ncbi:hypothetical protein PBI_RUFUS_55 [Mycobacterium phage Rufus]|uniref:Uncharacterized protein n=2 Tax=Caudoviricetes TaxID=2731619 RepID=G8I601_9CAUD|nr:hypothetical protein CM08_gp53 [Mycobacterium phage Bruns]YP_009043838.1 hypothetical protein PBI_PINTO_54 [Mycobacterium phage Pinto]YP_009199569.1 hypothetical protein AVV03_gp55 [Mycobacterium phage Rufus]AVJ49159.1 hypothetical protein SEA_BOB3_52 [Mycobacterium phage Bob3]AVP42543.1 hypothetical protein SEA_LOPTON_54 [Mycobacterium phage Lopton]AXH66003.1 hypothetical protein SEA_PITA2_57 [Mycobacterium phage Pita2]AXH67981.1 hypothetical protein SEA_SIBS6_56 [Mycobacterium phage Sibs
MRINFVALTRREGLISLEPDELEEAKEDGVDIQSPEDVAEYFRDKWESSRIIEDIVSDECHYEETELVEWSAL